MPEALAKLRKKLKKRKPRFKRNEIDHHPKLKDAWRKPKGRHSKKRQSFKGKGKLVKIGYGSPEQIRGLTHTGHREVRVATPAGIDRVDPKSEVAVIAHGVGRKKRFEIMKRAEEKGVRISNVRNV
jgi:large subunit ribosomal protein L32e